jgi:hypothetical protein
MADPAVEIALSAAADFVKEAMRPWEPEEEDLKSVIRSFERDFENVIAAPGKDGFEGVYKKIKRLFRYVGTGAALIAEAQQVGTDETKGKVGKSILGQACKLVEIGICPRPDPEDPRLRFCRLASILDPPESETALVHLVLKRFGEYKRDNHRAIGYTPKSGK